jgi:hypothetical protein
MSQAPGGKESPQLRDRRAADVPDGGGPPAGDRTETRPVASGVNLEEQMIWVLCSSRVVPV